MKNGNRKIGAYGEYDFVESIANAKLSIKLQETKLFKTHFAEGDKLPNLDGNIEILTQKERIDDKGNYYTVYEPEGSIYVQIKTLNHDYSNKNKEKFTEFKYKYSMDTKVINLVNVGARLEPVLIFLIDEKNEKYFWVHVSDEYAIGLNVKDQGNKVIFFSDENELVDVYDFHAKLRHIYRTRLNQIRDEESNRLMLLNMPEDTRINAQRLLSYLDETLINELSFITEYFYPDIWKFGVYISYDKTTKRTVLAIYEVRYGAIDTVLLRNYTSVNEVKSSFIISGTAKENNFIEFGKQFIQSLLEEYFKSNIVNPKYLPNIILNELAFSFLDTIASKCSLFRKTGFPNVYYKDTVDLTELMNHFETLTRFSQLKMDDYAEYFDEPDIIGFDPLQNLNEVDCEKYKAIFDDFSNELDNDYNSTIEVYLSSDKIPYKLYKNTLNELKVRNETLINRVWRHGNIHGSIKESNELKLKGIKGVGVGYTLSDIYFNTEKFLLMLPQAYNDTLNRLFQPIYKSKYSVSKKSFYFMDKNDPYLRLKYVTFKSDEYINMVNELPFHKLTLEEILAEDHGKLRESVAASSCSSSIVPVGVRSSKFRAFLYNELVGQLYNVICERNDFGKKNLSFLRPLL